jgi:hypothetical protein
LRTPDAHALSASAATLASSNPDSLPERLPGAPRPIFTVGSLATGERRIIGE